MEGVLHIEQLGGFAFGELLHRHAGPGRHDLSDVFLGDHRHPISAGALLVGADERHSAGRDVGTGFGIALAGFSAGRLLILAVLQDRADLLAQLHFLVAQLAGLAEVLLAHSILLLALDVAQLLVDLLGRRRQLGVHQAHAAAGFIDQVDRLVGQEAVGDVAIAEGGGSDQGLIGDLQAVVRLIALLQAAQDLDRVVDRWLAHLHRLEAALQCGIALDVLAVLIERGGADALQLAACQSRLEDVGGIDGTLGGPGADQGVHLVDHQDHVPGATDLLHDFLEALLELTAVLGAGHQQADVEGEDALVLKDVRHVAGIDALGEPFGDGGLADAGFADQHRIVLGAAAENLNDALNLVLAAHHRVELAVGGLLREVAAEFVERGGLGGALATAAAAGHFGRFAEHADHLGAHLGQVDAEVLQHPGGHAFAFADQAQQEVLGTDVVMSQLAGLL